MPRSLTHAIAFDDAPFTASHRGDVRIIGTVYAHTQLHAVLSGTVRRDGANATRELTRLVTGTPHHAHLHLILLQGVALAGFNVIDAPTLAAATRLPVLIVARRPPRMDRVRDALLTHVPGGARKWRLIEALGPMEACAGAYVQRVGLTLPEADAALRALTVHGNIPEPLRTAHLIAGGITTGHSRGRT